MKKLGSYFKTGKGRGLKFILLFSLILSIIFGGFTYYTGQTFSKHPMIASFINSVPSFEVKDGVVQDNQIRWASLIPLTSIPIVINTTEDKLSLPVPDGVYITRTMLYTVANRGTQIEPKQLTGTFLISPVELNSILKNLILSFSTIVAVLTFLITWVGFLLAVLFTALIGWIFRFNLSNKRVWRIVTITWILGLLTSLILAIFGIVIPTWHILLISLFINAVILAKLKD